MKHSKYNHCDGDRALPKDLSKEISDCITAIAIKPARGSATKLRNAFLQGLKSFGWSGEVTVSKDSDITITSMKNKVGLCMQTGNMARIYADLIKLQTLYLDNAIIAAAIVIPSTPIARLIGSNIAQASRLERELVIFRKAYHVPTIVFALE